MQGGVFICYRREDAAGFAGRIYDRLKNGLGRENVFIDVDNIPAGRDFVEVLSERVGRCDALVALIGKNWLAISDKDNRRRLDDPNDFVGIEIRAALERNVPVIPVLVDGAVMPQADDLPDGLKKLARRQGIEISHKRFDSDVELLTDALTRIEGAQARPSASPGATAAPLMAAAPKPAASARWLMPLAALAVIAGGLGVFFEQRGTHEEPSRQEEKTLPPPPTTSAPNAAAPSPRAAAPPDNASNAAVPAQIAALSAVAPTDNANNPAAPAMNAAPDETPMGRIADSVLAKIDKAVTLDAPTASQQWMNRDDFIIETHRQREIGNYPDKIWGRCLNSVPQIGAHWSPKPAGEYFLFHGEPEKDFKSDAADMIAKGFKMTSDSVFQGCEGSMRHITGWMKEG